MHQFPRKEKSTLGGTYFGEFDDTPLAPFSISLASFDESYAGEPAHYHTTNQKAYVVLEGAGILNVNGKQIPMTPDNLIQVEPNEIHHVEAVTKAPLKFVVVLQTKTDDKVVVEKK